MVLTGTVQSRETDIRNGSSRGGAFELSGTGTLNRDPFLLHLTGGPLINVRRDQPYHFDADLHAGQTHVVAQRRPASQPFDFRLRSTPTADTSPARTSPDLYYLTTA